MSITLDIIDKDSIDTLINMIYNKIQELSRDIDKNNTIDIDKKIKIIFDLKNVIYQLELKRSFMK